VYLVHLTLSLAVYIVYLVFWPALSRRGQRARRS
jgi:hypothetical protein